MGIKERWKNYPLWLKRGIIGGVVLFSIFFFCFLMVISFQDTIFDETILVFLPGFYVFLFFSIISSLLPFIFTCNIKECHYTLALFFIALIINFLIGFFFGVIYTKSKKFDQKSRKIIIGAILGIIASLTITFISRMIFLLNILNKYSLLIAIIGGIVGGFLANILSKNNTKSKKINLKSIKN